MASYRPRNVPDAEVNSAHTNHDRLVAGRSAVIASFIRIYLITYQNVPALHWGLMGCSTGRQAHEVQFALYKVFTWNEGILTEYSDDVNDFILCLLLLLTLPQ